MSESRKASLPEGKYVGRPVLRVEDGPLLRGRGQFIDDLPEKPTTLHAAILRSPHPHAEVMAIDASEALALPGVHAVITGEDVKPLTTPLIVGFKNEMDYRGIALDRVRYVGEPVAIACATDRYKAEKTPSTSSRSPTRRCPPWSIPWRRPATTPRPSSGSGLERGFPPRLHSRCAGRRLRECAAQRPDDRPLPAQRADPHGDLRHRRRVPGRQRHVRRHLQLPGAIFPPHGNGLGPQDRDRQAAAPLAGQLGRQFRLEADDLSLRGADVRGGAPDRAARQMDRGPPSSTSRRPIRRPTGSPSCRPPSTTTASSAACASRIGTTTGPTCVPPCRPPSIACMGFRPTANAIPNLEGDQSHHGHQQVPDRGGAGLRRTAALLRPSSA